MIAHPLCRTAAVAVMAVLAACGGGVEAPPEAPLVAVDCALPWGSMAQVRECASDGYTEASTDGIEVHVVIPSKDPEEIASALAGAFLDNQGNAEQIVVWAYGDRKAVGTGYDRGNVSEQGQLGELLVFQVCSTWMDIGEGAEICGDQTEFTLDQ